MIASRLGLRTLYGSFAVLLLTALAQAGVVWISGSAALLADTLHNAVDALSSIPIAIAFLLARRAASQRFPYGYGRAEDLAGLLVVALIGVSAALAVITSTRQLLAAQEVAALPVVAAAALVGFAGNEFVARWRISVGRRIGSAALIADGLHARTDGFTSLAVLVAVAGAALGWHWVDPVIGLLVAVAIGLVFLGAARQVFARLLDAADPSQTEAARRDVLAVPGVLAVEELRLRWSGHGQLAELTVVLAPETSLVAAHRIAHQVEQAARRAVPRLLRAQVHIHPCGATEPATGQQGHRVSS